jgi:predicted nucleic acid-binding protein
MAIAFDTSVLLYALLEPTTVKGVSAADLIERAALVNAIVPAQVLGEILAVVRRRRPELLDLAIATTGNFTASFKISPTDGNVIAQAGSLAARHRLQIWDAVICVSAIKAGATQLLTEDMQDGAALDGLRMIDPFSPANLAEIEGLLPTLG